MRNDEMTLELPGCVVGGWLSTRVTRSIERCPNEFEVNMTELFPGHASEVVAKPGDACKLRIGSDLVLTGYVDRVMRSMTNGQHEIILTGRGKCQDLVDCSALWKGGQITNGDVLQVAQKLAYPYGVSVSCAQGQDVGKPIPLFNFGLGETAYSIIETMCRYRALLAYELPDGSLWLERVSNRRASSGFTEGVNVEDASVYRSMDERFQKYDSFLVSIDTFRDAGVPNDPPPIYDEDVPRFRHRYVHVEAPPGMGQDVMLARARWEANRRIGRSFQVRLTTDSWRDSAGDLYEPNTLIEVDLPSLKVPKQDMLIGEVSYLKDANGTHCELIMMPPSAFDIQPATYPGWVDVKPVSQQ